MHSYNPFTITSVPTELFVDTTNKEQMVRALKATDVFKTLMEGELEQLVKNAKRLLFGPPECIVSQGEKGNSLFFVEKGKLDVYKLQTDSTNLKIGELSKGAIFGEMALLTGELRSATVIATSEVVVYEISKEDIVPILNRRKELVDEMSKLLAKRQIEADIKSANYNEIVLKNKESEIEGVEKKFKQLMRNFFNEKVE